MSDNKLVDKTRQVFEKQRELSSLITELKNEVRDVHNTNLELSEENLKLKQELELLREKGVTPTKKETPHIQEQHVEISPDVVPKPEVVPEPEVVPNPQVVPQPEVISQPQKEHKVYTEPVREPNAIVEFFLGKNIIAKIAAVLIFLGIITLGQMAYDWMPDIGKFIMIFLVGVLIFGLGFYAEKKKAIVFSNIFYITGLAVLYYSFLLVTFTFEIFNETLLSYSLLALFGFMVFYFRSRRYEFLDMILFVYSYVLLFTFAFYTNPIFIASNFSGFIELIGFVGLFVYYMTRFFTKDIVQNHRLYRFSQFLALLFLGTFLPIFSFDFLNRVQDIVSVSYIFAAIYLVYLFNYLYAPKDDEGRFLVPVVSTILLAISALGLFESVYFNMVQPASLFVFYYLILVAPLYTYLYIKKREDYPETTTYYVIIVGILLFVYSLLFSGPSSPDPQPFYVLNIVSAVQILFFFGLGKFTKDITHKVLAYIFLVLLVFRNFIYYGTDGTLLFNNDSNVIFVSLGLGLLMFGINLLFRHLKSEENEADYQFVNGFILLALIPLVMTFTNDLLSDELAYILAMVLLLVIGYRWLMELPLFKMEYKKYFIFVLNVGILLFTFGLNLIYFNHDFSQFEDVFKFLIMLGFNIYIVYSLREIYINHCLDEYIEKNFIILYGIGVTIQSFFIHNYINVEFDKVILSSYFLIASAVGVLFGFKEGWSITRRIGLFAIYYSLGKFFIYDFYTQDFTLFVRMITYFLLGFILLGISFLYAYLEKTYGHIDPVIPEKK